MINTFTSNRRAPSTNSAKVPPEQGQAVRALTPAETAEVSGGVWLLYWLLLQDAH